MVRKIELNFNNKFLELSINEENWCKLSLIFQDSIENLGADDFSIIKERLLNSLSKSTNLESSGIKDGLPIYWVLSLLEKHHSIYVQYKNDFQHFFIQNSNGDITENFMLNSKEIESWKNIISSI